jgi:nucleoid DNA-binding protein
MTKNETILQELGQFILKNYPVKNGPRGMSTMSSAEKTKVLAKKVDTFVQRAKVNLEWRSHLSERLNLSEEEVILATNTLIDMIERTLVNGGIVRLRNFGDFIPNDRTIGGFTSRTFYFKADVKWLKMLNPPLLASDIGLKRKLGGGKLTRRIEEPKAPKPRERARARKTSVQTES